MSGLGRLETKVLRGIVIGMDVRSYLLSCLINYLLHS